MQCLDEAKAHSRTEDSRAHDPLGSESCRRLIRDANAVSEKSQFKALKLV